MTNILLILFSTITLTGFAQNKKSNKVRRAEQQILITNRQWAEAVEHGDMAAFDLIFSEDLIVTSGSGEVENKAKEMDENKLDTGTSYSYFKTDDVRVRVYGNTAVVTGLCKWKMQENGQSITDQRRYISVFVKQKKRWRMVAQQMTRFLRPQPSQ